MYYLQLREPEPLSGTISNFQFVLSLLLSKVNTSILNFLSVSYSFLAAFPLLQMNYTTFKITNFDFDEQEFRNSVAKHVAFIQYYYNPINQTIWLQMININTITSLRKLFSKYFPSLHSLLLNLVPLYSILHFLY